MSDDSLEDFLILEEEESQQEIPRTYETDALRDERVSDRIGRRLRVLITVKTAPQPSKKYGDTVCVAGIALDGPQRWVRLYPIPFRHLAADKQFRKYSIISVKVSQSPNDPRYESLRVSAEGIQEETFLDTSGGWRKRAAFVEQMPESPLCQLQRQIRADTNGPSLGIVTPVPGTFRLDIETHPGWTKAQQETLDSQLLQQEIAFRTDPLVKQSLKAPRLKIWTCFLCLEPGCRGHRIGFLDWEVVALQHNNSCLPLDELKSLIRRNFEEKVLASQKKLRIFVGNQAESTKRAAFEALGLYYPNKEVAEAAASSTTLF